MIWSRHYCCYCCVECQIFEVGGDGTTRLSAELTRSALSAWARQTTLSPVATSCAEKSQKQQATSLHLRYQFSSIKIPNRFFESTISYLFPEATIKFQSTMAEPIEPPTTLSEESSAAMEVFNNVKVSLADLCAKGTAQYAHKNFEEAAELYARAAELQAELNGEMSPDNADILFLYGRSLFKVGQSKSDVLGGKAGGEKKKPNGSVKPKKVEAPKEEPKTEGEKITEEGVAIVAGQNGSAEEAVDAKKPLFQFTGDENFEDSDDDAEEVSTQRMMDVLHANIIIARGGRRRRRRRR